MPHGVAGESLAPGVDGKRAGLRIELIQSVLSPDPHSARVIEVKRIYLVVTQGSRPIHIVLVMGRELTGNRVEAIQTPEDSAKPECALTVLDHLRKERITLRIGPIGSEVLSRCVKPIQPSSGGRPECAIPVDEKTRNIVVAQALWIRRIVPVSPEASLPLVEAEDSEIVSADPDIPRPVFGYRNYTAIGS